MWVKAPKPITSWIRFGLTQSKHFWANCRLTYPEQVGFIQSKFTLSVGCTKEDYRAPFTKLIKKRINNIYYRAKIDALVKCLESHDDYQTTKAFPSFWYIEEK